MRIHVCLLLPLLEASSYQVWKRGWSSSLMNIGDKVSRLVPFGIPRDDWFGDHDLRKRLGTKWWKRKICYIFIHMLCVLENSIEIVKILTSQGVRCFGIRFQLNITFLILLGISRIRFCHFKQKFCIYFILCWKISFLKKVNNSSLQEVFTNERWIFSFVFNWFPY